MKYNCTINKIEDECEITIQIKDILLTGLDYLGMDENEINREKKVIIEFFDDIEITAAKNHVKRIERIGESFSYIITGVLDIDNALIYSMVDFDLNPRSLFDYGYLDKKYVELKILRMDFSFE